MRLVVALAVAGTLAIGCGNKSTSTADKCAHAAQQGVDAMVKLAHDRLASAQLPADVRTTMEERTKKLETMVPQLRELIAKRCVDDKWPADVIDCYAKLSSIDELRACRAKLSPELQARMRKEERDLFTNEMGAPGLGSPAPATSPEIAQREAELRDLNAKLADATKLVEDASTEADRAKAKALVQSLQEQRQATNELLAKLRADAAGSAASAKVASDLDQLMKEQAAVDQEVSEAVGAVADAKNDAERKAAVIKLKEAQKKNAELKAKIEAKRSP